MNNSRRKRINESILALKDAKTKLEQVLSEEQEALDRTPDDDEHYDMRNGMDDIISGLEDALSSLEESISTLDDADF